MTAACSLVTPAPALTLAKCVIRDRTRSHRIVPRRTRPAFDSLSVAQFFLAQEGGSMIPWAKFLLVAPAAAVALTDKASAERKAACREAFENKRAGQKSKSSPPPVAQPLAA